MLVRVRQVRVTYAMLVRAREVRVATNRAVVLSNRCVQFNAATYAWFGLVGAVIAQNANNTAGQEGCAGQALVGSTTHRHTCTDTHGIIRTGVG